MAEAIAAEPYSPVRQSLDHELIERDRAARGIVLPYNPKEELKRRIELIAERQQKAREMGIGIG